MRKALTWTVATLTAAAPLAIWAYISIWLYLTPSPPPAFSGEVAENIQLKTPETFRLAVLGDCRDNYAPVETLLKDAQTRADAAVIMGDLVNGGDRVLFRYLWKELHGAAPGFPLFFGIGNHDLAPGKNGDNYRAYFGPDHYWWRFGKNLFVMINNVERVRWKAELAWMDQVFREQGRPGDRIYIMMHKPPYLEGDEPGMPTGQSDTLHEFLAPHPNVTLLASHDHIYKEFNFQGIPVFVTGEAGAPQRRDPPLYGYILLECSLENCKLTHRELGFIASAGEGRKKVFVDFYRGWPVMALISGLTMIVLDRKRKKDRSG